MQRCYGANKKGKKKPKERPVTFKKPFLAKKKPNRAISAVRHLPSVPTTESGLSRHLFLHKMGYALKPPAPAGVALPTPAVGGVMMAM
ncbi:hypothetical protein EVAR_54498_1 [Eumeta japonica]|uniref:Uncharacterized protein n=1 Tax=Eumeta variegata TaxID=151549 RepID=A0A4C1YM42_EUMVA|nr:hypothetical protein EVAR_54498_1 [Eumeta japonica]